jgi:hypothetical protein
MDPMIFAVSLQLLDHLDKTHNLYRLKEFVTDMLPTFVTGSFPLANIEPL